MLLTTQSAKTILTGLATRSPIWCKATITERYRKPTKKDRNLIRENFITRTIQRESKARDLQHNLGFKNILHEGKWYDTNVEFIQKFRSVEPNINRDDWFLRPTAPSFHPRKFNWCERSMVSLEVSEREDRNITAGKNQKQTSCRIYNVSSDCARYYLNSICSVYGLNVAPTSDNLASLTHRTSRCSLT